MKKQLTKMLSNESVDILSKAYKINIKELENPNEMGNCFVQRAVINISGDLNIDHSSETLLHEIIHIISTENALDLSENQVSTLSCVLYDTFAEKE